jgi:hypothetical protein
LECFVIERQEPSSIFQQYLAIGGQIPFSGDPLKDWNTDLELQTAHLKADRRLRSAYNRRGFFEAADFRCQH